MSIAEPPSTDVSELELPPESTSIVSFVRRVLWLTFLLDTSGSMQGAKITSVDYAMGELVPIIRKMLTGKLAGYDLRVMVISFSSSAKVEQSWVSPESWTYSSLKADGGTSFEAAYDLWGQELSGLADTLSVAPVGILLSDGRPSRSPDAALKRLMTNPLAKHSQRAAVAVGSGADRNELNKFVSEGQKVYDVDAPEEIADAITAATLAAVEGSIAPATGRAADAAPSHLAGNGASIPSIIHSSLTPAEMQALRDAGIDPKELV